MEERKYSRPRDNYLDWDCSNSNYRAVGYYIVGYEKGEESKIGGVVTSIIEMLSGEELEYRDLYTELFFKKGIPVPAKIIINKYSNDHQNCLVPHQHFLAMIFDIVKALSEYKLARSRK